MTKTELNDPDTILPLLDRHAIDMIVLAGFLLMMPVFIIERYQEKIINIHLIVVEISDDIFGISAVA